MKTLKHNWWQTFNIYVQSVKHISSQSSLPQSYHPKFGSTASIALVTKVPPQEIYDEKTNHHQPRTVVSSSAQAVVNALSKNTPIFRGITCSPHNSVSNILLCQYKQYVKQSSHLFVQKAYSTAIIAQVDDSLKKSTIKSDKCQQSMTLQTDDGSRNNYFNWKSKSLYQKILIVFGFCSGVVIGGYLKIAYNYGLFARQDKDEFMDCCSLYDPQVMDLCMPIVSASKGFNFTQTEEHSPAPNSNDKYNSVLSMFGGKGPPKHRANFNFIADVVERLAPSVVFIDIKDLRR